MRHIIKYQLPNGKIPFDDWLFSLDKPIRAKVLIRIERLKTGLYGKHRKLKKGIAELKFESGERIYFYEDNDTIILLLKAGDKKRQSNDIKTAEIYLDDYKGRINYEKQNA